MSQHQSGFTLTELVVTVAIVGILGSAGALAIRKLAPASPSAAATIATGMGNLKLLTQGSATPADAIAAGFPPDFRGRVVISVQACPGAPGSPYPAGTEFSFPCPSTGNTWEVRSERLKAGGGFETISTGNLPGAGRPGPEGGMSQVYVTEGANITTGVTCEGAACKSSEGGNLVFPLTNDLKATMLPQGGKPISCYANGTCDAVTYWFPAKKGSYQVYSRVAVTPTGSVVAINSWGSI